MFKLPAEWKVAGSLSYIVNIRQFSAEILLLKKI